MDAMPQRTSPPSIPPVLLPAKEPFKKSVPHLILKEDGCENLDVLKTITDDLSSTATDDALIARHIANACRNGYLDFLQANIKTLGLVINDNVRRILEAEGLRLMNVADQLFGIAVMKSEPRHAAIDTALSMLPSTIIDEICRFDAPILINESNAKYICWALTEGTPEQKGEIFVAISEQNRVPFFNLLVKEQLIALLTVKQGPENSFIEYSGWRLEFADVDFSGLNLTGIVWGKVDLSRANFAGATLVGVDFSRALCYETNFSGANLACASFSEDVARESEDGFLVPLSKAKLNWANFTNANLSRTFFCWHDLRRTTLKGATLTGANLHNTDLSGVDLTGARLGRTNLSKSHLSNTDLSGQDLTGGLRGSVLTGANLAGAHVLHGTKVFIKDNLVMVKSLQRHYPDRPIIFEGEDDSCVIL